MTEWIILKNISFHFLLQVEGREVNQRKVTGDHTIVDAKKQTIDTSDSEDSVVYMGSKSPEKHKNVSCISLTRAVYTKKIQTSFLNTREVI